MTATPLTPEQAKRASAFFPQVEILARQVVRMLPSIPVSDLIGVGNEALVLAAGRYDPEMGTQFSTYVHYRVRGAMLDFARRRNPARRQNNRALKLLEASQSLLEQAQLSTAGEKASLELRVAAAKALVEKTAAAAILASSTPLDPESVADEPSAETQAIYGQQRDQLRDAMRFLEDEDRDLIEALYFEDVTMHAFAQRIGKNISTVSRRHARILGELAVHMRARPPS